MHVFLKDPFFRSFFFSFFLVPFAISCVIFLSVGIIIRRTGRRHVTRSFPIFGNKSFSLSMVELLDARADRFSSKAGLAVDGARSPCRYIQPRDDE